jgi:hypothetical protein
VALHEPLDAEAVLAVLGLLLDRRVEGGDEGAELGELGAAACRRRVAVLSVGGSSTGRVRRGDTRRAAALDSARRAAL